jgi:hypothetical protein
VFAACVVERLPVRALGATENKQPSLILCSCQLLLMRCAGGTKQQEKRGTR